MRRLSAIAASLAFSFALFGCKVSFSAKDHCFPGDPCAGEDVPDVADVPTVEDAADATAEDTADAPAPVDTLDVQPDAGPPDGDEDGVPDDGDLCPNVWNPGQYDTDKDGIGDECDPCPFSAVNEATCYSGGFKGPQIEGRWSGILVRSTVTEKSSTVASTTVDIELAGDTYLPPGSDKTSAWSVQENGVLWLRTLVTGDAPRDALLLVDERRQVAVGSLFGPKGAADAGKASPPSLIVLMRRRVAPAGAPKDVVESFAPPGRPIDRKWHVSGFAAIEANAPNAAASIQGTVRSVSTKSSLTFQAGNSSDKTGLLYHFPGLAESLPETSARERRDEGFVIEVGDVVLKGYMSFERDLAIVQGSLSLKGKLGSYVLLLTEDLAKEEVAALSPAPSRLGFVAMNLRAGIRGYLPDGSDLTKTIGLEFHDYLGVPTAVQEPVTYNSWSPYGIVAIDSGLSISTGGMKLTSPMTCLRPTSANGLSVAHASVCKHSGALNLGCRDEVDCGGVMGLAVRLGDAFGAADFDLDGKDSGDVKGCKLGDNAGTVPDACPCTLNPELFEINCK